MKNQPPKPPQSPPVRDYSPPVILGAIILLIGIAYFGVKWNLPLPACGFRRLTGIPCPFCGSTHCLVACARLDFAGALRFNPLTFMALVGLAGWCLLWVAEVILKKPFLAPLTEKWRRFPLKHPLILLILLNWAWLYWQHRHH